MRRRAGSGGGPLMAASGYPDGKEFAFTVIDDTDDSRLDNIVPLYDLLTELGFRTTKTVWPEPCPEGSADFFAGATLEDAEYRAYCLELQRRGFEIAWHGATMESSTRDRTLAGLETYRKIFGSLPQVHANHAMNRESIYWGPARYRTVVRHAARWHRWETAFEGEVESSPYFWGDLCRRHIRFVRNFSFREINTLKVDADTPYQLRDTPFVNFWFSAADAPDVHDFNRLVTPEAIDRLRRERGLCILATHFGKGFVQDGRVNPAVERALRHLAELPVWVAPVSVILEHRIQAGAGRPLGAAALFRLELRHVLDRLRAAS